VFKDEIYNIYEDKNNSLITIAINENINNINENWSNK